MISNIFSKLKQKSIICIFCAILPCVSLAQTGDQINYLDANNKKQGFWSKRDEQGNKVFEGTFKNNIPVGEFKRFHPNGQIKHLMNYNAENPLDVSAKIFDANGVLISQGTFYDQKKHGLWQYFENNKLIAEDMYDKGVLDGTSTIYWQNTANKQTTEVKNWSQGKKHGAWLWFYETGQLRMVAYYVNNKLEGDFTVYYANGVTLLSGVYKNDMRDGDWVYRNEDGSVQTILQYANGKMLNEDEYEREQTRLINEQWKDMPDFAEPDMNAPETVTQTAADYEKDPNDPNNYIDNPEEFVMREIAPGVDFDVQQEAPSKKKKASSKSAKKLKK